MSIFSLSCAYIRSRFLTSVLLVILLAIGVATISLLLHFSHQAEERLTRDAHGFDLVVGAKGSPLQLILSSIYHMDIPTGNIPLREAGQIKTHPQVKQAIPLALGDSYHGYRIVGTDTSYIGHYNGELAEGRNFNGIMEAVIGARVAQDTTLAIGGNFAGSHGLSEGGEEHADSPYKVVGILKPTGTVIDRLILTPVESVWKVHGSETHHHHEHEGHEEGGHHADEHDEHENHTGETQASDEITSLLVTFRSPVAAMSLPREINRMTSMQAASPAFETARLLSLLGMGMDTLRIFGAILIASAVIGMLVAIYQSMQERRPDLALMRVLGASKQKLLKLIMFEAGLLLVAGIACGFIISHIGLNVLPSLSPQLKDLGFMPFRVLREELYIAAGLTIAGLAVAVFPALGAYRVDVSRTLAKS